MDKQQIIEFFDRLAPHWDSEQADRSAVIGIILDNAGIGPGQHVLDVACGTGVMFSHYLSRGVESVAGIDIAPEMARRAAAKFAGAPNVRVICGDVESTAFDRRFDRIVVYNAFPHFPDGQRLIRRLWNLLADGGRMTIAHGFSRETINAHHSGSARNVSSGLIDAETLRTWFEPYFHVDVCISNDEMYQVAGTRRS